MIDDPDEQLIDLRAIEAECARIGFSLRDLGGLALSGHDAAAAFLGLLRDVPTGVGLEGFRQRCPDVAPSWTAEEELRELARDSPTSCSFCGRSRTAERRLVCGPNQVAICRDCVRLASEELE